MDINTINVILSRGEINTANVFPHLSRLAKSPYQFHVNFGLDELPVEPGIIMIDDICIECNRKAFVY